MLTYRVRRTIDDVDVSTVSFPSGHSFRKVLVAECEATVVFFLEGVLFAAGVWIALFPELDDKVVALLIGREFQKLFFFLGRDEPANIFIKPLVIFRS